VTSVSREAMKKGICDSKYFVLFLSRNTREPNQNGKNWVVEELNFARSIGKPTRILMKTDPRFGGVATFEEMKRLTPVHYRWVFESDEEVVPSNEEKLPGGRHQVTLGFLSRFEHQRN